MTQGLIIAAPASGSGKTTVTLALLRYFRDQGRSIAALKVGPDYIDPAYHAAACGLSCGNIDTWAMRSDTITSILTHAERYADLIIAEGVMGLFDGAAGGGGSTAEVARRTGWPIILVIDVRGMGASVAALLQGFSRFDPELDLAGVVFNRVGSPAHLELLEEAVSESRVAVLGGLPNNAEIALPSRPLGLVQAKEHPDLEGFLSRAAAWVGAHIETDVLLDLFRESATLVPNTGTSVPPLGQRIAIARDEAFLFVYPHVLECWRSDGAEIHFFSPLAGEGPAEDSDAVFLPGGYPELHAGTLAANSGFLDEVRHAAARGAVIYGECGGYMVLGDGIIDERGVRHAMAGLLPLTTTFEHRRRTLGYRLISLLEDGPLGAAGQRFRGHEFHYARTLEAESGDHLFECRDARGNRLPVAGLRRGSVMGSFCHLVDRAGQFGAERV